MSAIVVEGLTKHYGDVAAVDDVSFSVEPGEIFVLLGANGAGKTTTVEIVEGLRDADAGRVDVLGQQPTALDVRRRMGVMLQRGDLYAGIRAGEAVRLFASFYDEPAETEQLIERLGLEDVQKTTYRRLSGGERRRLSLALALVGRPDVAFLDEPTAEMDVEGRVATWEIVRELRSRGAAVLLTTHQLDEAERVADRVAIMHHGKLVAVGAPSELVSERTPEIVFTVDKTIDHDALSAFLPATVTPVEGTTYRVSGEQPNPTLVSRVTTWLAARGVMVRTMRVGARSLEEIYLELTR